MTPNIDTFTRAYLTCALWAEIDDKGEPLDRRYGLDDIAPDSLNRAIVDCQTFQAEHAADLEATGEHAEMHGHDLWLTRNGHGAGFWARGYADDVAKRLTEAAQDLGEVSPYVGDDGRIYI